jgi:hypothetical protein
VTMLFDSSLSDYHDVPHVTSKEQELEREEFCLVNEVVSAQLCSC